MKVKICRVNSLQSALELVSMGVDYLGFHDLQGASLDKSVHLAMINRRLRDFGFDGGVLLTKAADISWISQAVSMGAYSLVQLHRKSNLAEIEELVRKLKRVGACLIQVVDPSFYGKNHVYEVLTYARYVLYDNYKGGTGQRIDDSTLESMPMERAFIAGGIDDLRASQLKDRYQPYAIDVQSWVERIGGDSTDCLKDIDRVYRLVKIARRMA